MKLTKRHMAKGFTLVELLVVIAIIAALAAMATPVILKQKKKADATTAVNNAKQIFYLMIEFDGDFNTFPDAASATSGGYTAPGTSANKALGQLIEGGYTNSEEIFFAKGGAPTKGKPDNDIASGKILEAGECGFAYYMGLSTSDSAGLPLVASPAPNTENTFEKSPYGGKVVILRIDGSCQQLRIGGTTDEISGSALVRGGDKLEDEDIYTNAVTNGMTVLLSE